MNSILKFAKGGLSELFISPTDMVETSKSEYGESDTSTAKNSSSASSKSEKVGLKDLLNLAKELKGLPTDSDVVTKQIYSIYNNMDLYADGELDTSQLISAYLQTLRSVRQAQFNQEQYNEAKKQALAKDGLGEIAVDKYGNVFVQDKETGNMGRMSIEEYKQLDKNKYEILTNSNLLYYRANSPEFAFKNDILGIVENGIGISEITKHLLQVASNLGTNSVRDARYQTPQSEEISEGLKILQEAEKKNIKLDELSSDQKAQAEYALKYLWAALPENEKTVLKYKSDGTEKGATDLIQTLIFSRTSQKDSANESASGKGGNSKSSGGNNVEFDEDATGIEMTPSIGFILGKGYSREIKMNPGTVYEFNLHGINGVITDHSGKPLGEYSTLNDASNGAFAGILDWGNVTYGGVKVETLNKVFLKNADIVSMDLPIDIQYFNETGIIRPDIDLTTKMQKLDQAIQQKKVNKDNVEQVNAFCESINLPTMYVGYDENGHPKLDSAYYARFARIGALVDENSLQEDIDVGAYASHEASDKVRENFKQYMKTHDKNYSLDDGGLFSTHDKLYEGAVFIPIREDIIASTYGGSKYYKLPTENAISAAQRWADDQVVQTYSPGKKLGEVK